MSCFKDCQLLSDDYKYDTNDNINNISKTTAFTILVSLRLC